MSLLLQKTASSSQGKKTCQGCGVDLAGMARIKDTKGRYWCHDCDARYAAAKAKGALSQCPDCGLRCPLASLVRADERYICEACEKKQQASVVTQVAGAPRRRLTKMFAALGALFMLMTYVWYDFLWG